MNPILYLLGNSPRVRRWLCGSLFLLVPFQTWAQASVTGVVTSEDNRPLPGVSIVIKGTTKGTTSDANGKFALSVAPDDVLTVSSVGYQTQDVTVGNRTSLDIKLLADSRDLSEVVVVGYGTQRRSDLTGAIASVAGKEIQQRAVVSVGQALQGRAPGVQVTQTSAAPGGNVSVRIRGGNSIGAGNEPLYVIDGFPLYNGLGNAINPNDVESIEVLKDASATAIYGSRASNGVVIVTTRRGKSGKPTIEFDTYSGSQQVIRTIPLLNAKQQAEMRNEALVKYRNQAPSFTQAQIDAMGEGTDWQNEVFRNAPIQNYQLSIAGGTDKVRYAVTGGHFDQQGIVVGSGYQRQTFRLNLDADLSNRLRLGASLTLTRSQNKGVASDNFQNNSVIYNTLFMSPLTPVRDSLGNYPDNVLPYFSPANLENPLSLALNRTNISRGLRVLGLVYGEYQLAEGLRLRISAGVNTTSDKSDRYVPSFTLSGRSDGGQAFIDNVQTFNWLNENTLTYEKTLGRHAFTGLAGITVQRERSDLNSLSAFGFPNDALGTGNVGAASNPRPPFSNVSEWALLSYLGRVNYGFANKLLVTLSARADGSSRFGANNKWGFFPSGAVAYKLTEEPFLKRIAFVSELKVRASYGLTGNAEIGQYRSLDQLGTVRYVFGNSAVTGFVPVTIANPDLRWERTAQFDAGLDLGVWQNRIQVTADYYVKTTNDLLQNVAIPVQSGFGSTLINLGKVENRGFELGLTSRNVTGKFTWTTTANIAFNRNRVLDLGGVTEIFQGTNGLVRNTPSSIVRVGQPLGSFYGAVFEGIWQSTDEIARVGTMKTNAPGTRRFADLNGDGTFDGKDYTILGSGQPNFIYGFSNEITFAGFDLNVFFQGSQGNKILNLNLLELERGNIAYNQSVRMLDRWNGPGTSNEIPHAGALGNQNLVHSQYVEDGSYLRLATASLGYNLPLTLKWLQSARLYVAGDNLLTVTKYRGYDPEVNSSGSSNTVLGIDQNAYPRAKSYRLGLTLRF